MTTSPTLGEDYDPLGAHAQDPYAFYALARQQQPVFFYPELAAWVVTRYNDVRAVLRDAETFSSANSLRPVAKPDPAVFAEFAKGFPMVPEAVTSDGAAHRRLRRPFADGLGPDQVRAVEPFIRQRAGELVDVFAGDGHAELMRQYADPLPLDAIGRLFNLQPADLPVVHAGSLGMVVLGSARATGEQQVEARRAGAGRGHRGPGAVRLGQPRPGAGRPPGGVRHHPAAEPASGVRVRRSPLRRGAARSRRAAHRPGDPG